MKRLVLCLAMLSLCYAAYAEVLFDVTWEDHVVGQAPTTALPGTSMNSPFEAEQTIIRDNVSGFDGNVAVLTGTNNASLYFVPGGFDGGGIHKVSWSSAVLAWSDTTRVLGQGTSYTLYCSFLPGGAFGCYLGEEQVPTSMSWTPGEVYSFEGVFDMDAYTVDFFINGTPIAIGHNLPSDTIIDGFSFFRFPYGDSTGELAVDDFHWEYFPPPQEWFVSPEGNHTAGTNWTTAFTNIQAAVDAAASNDTIRVANGTYAPIATGNKAITIQSVNGPMHTMIDAGHTNDFVFIGGAEHETDSVVNGFTLENSTGRGIQNGTVNNCIIRNNAGGGAFRGVMNNCIFTGNTAGNGAAVVLGTLNNCTVVGNEATGAGGGAYQSVANNCIFFANKGTEVVSTNSCYVSGNPNLDSPQLVDWQNGDFRLLSISPCIGAGDTNLLVVGVDMFGNQMIVDGRVNQGALVEVVQGTLSLSHYATNVSWAETSNITFEVEANFAWQATTTNDWISISTPSGSKTGAVVFSVSRSAVAHEQIGTIVVSSGGTNGLDAVFTLIRAAYTPFDILVDQNQTNNPADGRTWATAFTNIQEAIDAAYDADRVLVTNGIYSPIDSENKLLLIQAVGRVEDIIIDGGWNGDTNNPTGMRCATLWQPDTTLHQTVLSGFTLRNGYHDGYGGAGAYGGTLNNCVLTNNFSMRFGGGAYLSALNQCTLANNLALGGGGGGLQVTLNNCLLTGNFADDGGGAYRSTLNNCVVVSNSANVRAIGNYCELYNCTIVGNQAPWGGGGYYGSDLRNCIVWGNTTPEGTVDNESWGRFVYSSYIGTAEDPAEDDPWFVDWKHGDFRLYSISPCVGMGDTNLVKLAMDMFGNPMIVDGKVNQGALAEVVTVRVTTNNAVPYVWLEEHGLVPMDSPDAVYEAADLADRDEDGFANWEEYIAGTDPTNQQSFFKVGIGTDTDGAEVWWAPKKSGRAYDVLGTDSMTNPFATWGATNADSRFFRIKVRMPE